MSRVKHHYDTFLADAYTWMLGGFDARITQSAALFERLNVTPGPTGRAIDIGCGTGFQTLPLLRRGFAVDAVDFSEQLSSELRSVAGAESGLRLHVLDAVEYLSESQEPVDLIVCMGDTLVHFESRAYLTRFLQLARARLHAFGTMVITIRDYSQTLTGADCVIPVRLSDHRMLTCVLAYTDESIVVTDLRYDRHPNGDWIALKSTYLKLRILPGQLNAAMHSAGFAIREASIANGLLTLVAGVP